MDHAPDNRASWVDLHDSPPSSHRQLDLDYLRAHPSAAQPPSPYSPGPWANRPRAPTPSAAVPPIHDDTWSPVHSDHRHVSSRPYPEASRFSLASDDDDDMLDAPQPLARPAKRPHLPDPSAFPDPYPSRVPSSTPPASSADSSSTRSSAYTSFGSALAQQDLNYVHVHSASDESDPHAHPAILPEDVAHLMNKESPLPPLPSAGPDLDHSHWSEFSESGGARESSGGGIRSRSSSLGRATYDAAHVLRVKGSYDMSWQPVDERDELLMTSEDDTDDDFELEDDDDNRGDRTAAIVIAEEGRGLIVRGEGIPIVQLQVQPGTTHLLLGSSSTPNAVPSFLANTLPQISHSLLALDISANFLSAIPPALASCTKLEELNIASNPLRALPVFLVKLEELRVLIADSTGINTLPAALDELDKLHTLSIRRNKLTALPSWLCMLHSLQTLLVDGNPFQGPWKALVDPLLSKEPSSTTAVLFTPATPSHFSLHSSSAQSFDAGRDADLDEPVSASNVGAFMLMPEEDDTIVPGNLVSPTPEPPLPPPPSPTPSLARRKTAPNRRTYDRTRANSKSNGSPAPDMPSPPRPTEVATERQMRRMKSAGDLRRGLEPPASSVSMYFPNQTAANTPQRPTLTHYATSTSGANLVSTHADGPPQRFASLGAASALSTPGLSRSFARPALDQSVWDNISGGEDEDSPTRLSASKDLPSPHPRNSMLDMSRRGSKLDKHDRADKEKGRWGFLKKMSMGKIKDKEPSSRPGSSSGMRRPPNSRSGTASGHRLGELPLIDIRLSTTGTLNAPPSLLRMPSSDKLNAGRKLNKKPSIEALKLSKKPSIEALQIPSGGLMAPSSPTPRSAKRRSFLPIGDPPQSGPAAALTMPAPYVFMPGVTAINGNESDDGASTPSPIVSEQPDHHRRKEEERAREAYTRALRSVMAYLRDLNDLGLAVSGAKGMEVPRSRRPTLADGGRSMTESSIDSSAVTDRGSVMTGTSGSTGGTGGQLRSVESINGLRNVPMSQTLSTATTDSNDSGTAQERKFKDDRSKRSMIVREIIETERTYVKGLQELVDIYIKPAAAPLNVLTPGASGKKETVVPVPERKVVFGGVESLCSFHRESFLPALEAVAAPLMQPSVALATVDADGLLSMTTARAVAMTFISHAAFMKMYSQYINNFDNSVQRIKTWTADRSPASGTATPPSLTSPSSSGASAAQVAVAGLGLRMSAVGGDASSITIAGASAAHNAKLTAGQRKRIKQYLKRCRMNPRHSQMDLTGYLLLPVQRIPRYRLLLEELGRSTPPGGVYGEDPLDKALEVISSLATNMNEGKRESESRSKLVQWQSRIRGRFPSPLVQPHRRLIMDGFLRLTRVVRKTVVSYDVVNPSGDTSTVQVECLAPEMTPRALVGILCNDLLVLCRDPSEGQDHKTPVDLWAVLRMQTLPQPASIVYGNVLRIVDNKAVLYFDAPSASEALNWYRAININIPASKT